VSAREQVLANQLTPVSQVTFRVRFRSDVVLTDRVVHDGVSYDIQHIAEVGRREGLDILVKMPSEE
jgi:SPP1 family predicted phage head-tail adaptor